MLAHFVNRKGKYQDMKLLLNILFVAFISMSFVQVETKNDIVDELAELIRDANVKDLSAYFDSTVELTLQERESTYSKAQTEIILKNFFLKNPPKSFKVMHRGASEKGGRYMIGMLTTESGASFRTSIVMQDKTAGLRIQQLRFE